MLPSKSMYVSVSVTMAVTAAESWWASAWFHARSSWRIWISSLLAADFSWAKRTVANASAADTMHNQMPTGALNGVLMGNLYANWERWADANKYPLDNGGRFPAE